MKHGGGAIIKVNGKKVDVEKSLSGHNRGLHIVVINNLTFKIMFTKVFDTYATSSDLDTFIIKIKIPEGYIIAAASDDDCTKNLSKLGKMWFDDMGSKHIRYLNYRHGFAFIGKVGFKEANEAKSVSEVTKVSITNVFNAPGEKLKFDIDDKENLDDDPEEDYAIKAHGTTKGRNIDYELSPQRSKHPKRPVANVEDLEHQAREYAHTDTSKIKEVEGPERPPEVEDGEEADDGVGHVPEEFFEKP